MQADKEKYTQTFDGGIYTTIAPELLPSNAARYILNCNILSTSAGNVGIVTNIKGNKEVTFTLPSGVNQALGYAKDEERTNLYLFFWNSNNYHTVYRFNYLDKSVIPVLQNITDTGGDNIFTLTQEMILHADVVMGDLLYWTQKGSKARKTSIKRCLDKTSSGYGNSIREEYINAYKPAPTNAPVAEYFSDESKNFNRIYGRLYKFISRFVYRDGEKSDWSDFGNVPLPLGEPITGITDIPTNNNSIKVTVDTGSPDVKLIEVAMQSTDSATTLEGVLDFFTIAYLDKGNIGISNDSTYTYTWYNDQSYVVTDMAKVIRPYSYLPDKPLCQAFVNNALTYFNFYEGFENVDVSATVDVEYTDLTISDEVENEFNDPHFDRASHETDYVRGSGGNRETQDTLLIGADVKKGNIFTLQMSVPEVQFFGNASATWTYKATAFDTAITVANYFRNKIFEWSVPKLTLTDVATDIDDNASFTYRLRWYEYVDAIPSVTPIQFNSLKDSGESKNNIKLGSSFKVGIEYMDDDGRKSLVYTDDSLTIDISPINEFEGFKKPIITLQVKHRPPVWAKYYQIVRSKDLIYDKYIQLLIQDVVPVDTSGSLGDYLDLVVGSLFTYQKLHENTVLQYSFEKGDRIRMIKYFDPDTLEETYYPFYETEIISYSDSVDTQKDETLATTAGSATVTVAAGSSADNIGKVILVDGIERIIIDAPTGTTYTMNNAMAEAKTYASYHIIDRRGTLRIRKPPASVISTLNDLSLVEIYKPSTSGSEGSAKTFYEFLQKFPIINWGTSTRAHGGVQQNQDGTSDASLISTPAIVKWDNGTAYVRNRELPITSSISGTMAISAIEDAGYSDFYNSTLNNNGRLTVQDTGDGKVFFGSRGRFSSNFIEDTRINGLNDFDNGNREDYNDQYGDIMRTIFDENRIYAFKALKFTWIPVSQSIISQSDGTPVVGLSNKLLNKMQYFAWEGGVGNNPESVERNASNIYAVSTNSGVVIRIGGDGITPVSEIYHLDNEIRGLLSEASKNNARIIGGFDRESGVYIFSIVNYKKFIFNDVFNQSSWILSEPELPTTTTFELVLPPDHGDVDFNDTTYQFVYTPDEGYVGSDSFTYRAFVNGSWTNTRKVCLSIQMPANRATAWRGKESTTYCVLDGGLRTGYRDWVTLEQYYQDDNTLTGLEKPNDGSDSDYIYPIFDDVTCDTTPITISSDLNIVVDPETGDQAVRFSIIFSSPTPEPVDVSWAADYTVNGTPNPVSGTLEASDTYVFTILTYPSTDTIVLTSDSITDVEPDPVDGIDIIF